MTGPDPRPLVVVLLGTDHHRFDRLVGWAAELARHGEYRWFVQHGHTPLPDSLDGRPMLPAHALADLLGEAHAVVTHGGPGLIMDARSAGHLPIVIPRDPAHGEHVDGHQIAFAARMVDTGQVRTATSAGELAAAARVAVAERESSDVLVGSAGGNEQSLRASQRFGELVAELCPPSVDRVAVPADHRLAGLPVVGPQRGGSSSLSSGPPPAFPRQRDTRAPGIAPRESDAPLTRGTRRLRDALADPRPVTVLAAELAGASLAVAALGAPVPLLALWALTMSVVHASGARYAERQPLRHGLQLGLTALAMTATIAFALDVPLDRTETSLALGVMAATTTCLHWLRLLASRAAGTARPRVVMVGGSHHLPQLLSDLSRQGGLRLDVVGACVTDVDEVPDSVTAALPASVPVTTGLQSILPSVQVMGADAVVAVPWAGLEPKEMRRLEWQLARHGTDLWVAPGLFDTDPGRTDVLAAGAARLLRVRPSSLYGTRRMVKDASERAAAALCLLLLAPLLLPLMLAVRLDSPGPALFRQRRVGRDGSIFTMVKLRTMASDAESRLAALACHNESDGALFKLREDPRVTRLGRVLRRLSLDELPQLWNVVRGEMSLIGPRPSLPHEVAEYAGDTYRRLTVKPGLTGLWQVSGRSNLSWEESQRLDLKYVDNWSLRSDLMILMRTLPAVLGRNGAY